MRRLLFAVAHFMVFAVVSAVGAPVAIATSAVTLLSFLILFLAAVPGFCV
jgi:hypothetical protein